MNFSQMNGSEKQTLDSLYAEMARLKNGVPTSQTAAYRTVFNDIADEWANCSDDERSFIDSNQEYVNANLVYQQQFNAFLLDMVGLQFINSQYGKSAESVLIALRNAKTQFKKAAADNVASVKAQNAELQKQIEELKRMIGEDK